METQEDPSTKELHDFMVTAVMEVRGVATVMDALDAIQVVHTDRVWMRNVTVERLSELMREPPRGARC